jgi:short subunit dehydrogenase-like uncharacterized protein
MATRILLYGATGFSGRLIATEASRRRIGYDGDFELSLGARDRLALADLASALQFGYVSFALDDQRRVQSVLRTFDVVINAAGPFAGTGPRLAKAAIASGCHYVDINGEIDVYKALDDLDLIAKDRGVSLVSGAGFTATASDVLVDLALAYLASLRETSVGAIRIAISAIRQLSRGSLATTLRSFREQVTIVQRGAVTHVPTGMLERAFDFGRHRGSTAPDARRSPPAAVAPEPAIRVASAVNAVDTLTALRTAARRKVETGRIETYVDMPSYVRLGYQVGAVSAVVLQLPWVQRLGQLQVAQLPEGPGDDERRANRHTVVLQIETPLRELVVDWLLETPDSYEFTARSALAVATSGRLARSPGWRTPSDILAATLPGDDQRKSPAWIAAVDPFEDCTLQDRRA